MINPQVVVVLFVVNLALRRINGLYPTVCVSKLCKCKSRVYYIIDDIEIDHKMRVFGLTCRSCVNREIKLCRA